MTWEPGLTGSKYPISVNCYFYHCLKSVTPTHEYQWDVQLEGKGSVIILLTPQETHFTITLRNTPQLQITQPPALVTAPFRWRVQNSSTPSSATPPAPPASSSYNSIHPGIQAKNLGVILDSISNPSTNSAGLTVKYIENAVTSDHLHCHHQLSPRILLWPTTWLPCFCWPHYSIFSAKWPQWSFEHRSGHSSVWNPLTTHPLFAPWRTSVLGRSLNTPGTLLPHHTFTHADPTA